MSFGLDRLLARFVVFAVVFGALLVVATLVGLL